MREPETQVDLLVAPLPRPRPLFSPGLTVAVVALVSATLMPVALVREPEGEGAPSPRSPPPYFSGTWPSCLEARCVSRGAVPLHSVRRLRLALRGGEVYGPALCRPSRVVRQNGHSVRCSKKIWPIVRSKIWRIVAYFGYLDMILRR
jgi:hypothetical protein